MLFTIAAIIGILWLLGMIAQVTFGGLIHVLIVVAALLVLVRLFRRAGPA